MTCKLCGCTDEQACPGGCFWVWKEVCSECVMKKLLNEAQHHGRAGAIRLIQSMEIAIEILGQALDMDEVTEPAGAAAGEPPLPRLWRPGDPI